MNEQEKSPSVQARASNLTRYYSHPFSCTNDSTGGAEIQVKNTSHLTQPVSFAGLPYGATDIDLLCEWHDIAYIFADLKHHGAPLSTGQRIAYERAVNAIQGAEREAIFFLVAHNVTAPAVITASAGIVERYYYLKEWKVPQRRGMTLAEAQASFIQQAEAKHGGRP